MNSFLELVAKDLYQKCDGNFQNLTIIFPNKRASLFFNQHIFSIANAPLWAPTYLTISELFQTLSPLEVADTIELVCRLYQAYEEAYQQNGEVMDETLDKFYSWGELMLSDFQDIDNNHVDAEQLFCNISDINDLTRFDYLSKEQVKALQEYFQDFDISTLLKENYMSLWKILPTIYTSFRKELRTAGLAYEGMLKRNVVSRLGGELPDD
ncbi:MAG: PD-(D/E)XK nuclease family protein, partial [Bacteroidaceae bacterium]|nr:PD-(D/E)XK nuclease family protein [Bacteroidaceae bacterium]